MHQQHQNKFHVCVNLLGNKSFSDSDTVPLEKVRRFSGGLEQLKRVFRSDIDCAQAGLKRLLFRKAPPERG